MPTHNSLCLWLHQPIRTPRVSGHRTSSQLIHVGLIDSRSTALHSSRVVCLRLVGMMCQQQTVARPFLESPSREIPLIPVFRGVSVAILLACRPAQDPVPRSHRAEEAPAWLKGIAREPLREPRDKRTQPPTAVSVTSLRRLQKKRERGGVDLGQLATVTASLVHGSRASGKARGEGSWCSNLALSRLCYRVSVPVTYMVGSDCL